MEAAGTLCEGEYWNALCGMVSDEADFMAQLLGTCPIPGDRQDDQNPSLGNQSAAFSSQSNHESSNLQYHYLPQRSTDITYSGSSYSSSTSFCSFPNSNHKNPYIIADAYTYQMFDTNNINGGYIAMDFGMDENQANDETSFPDNLMEDQAVVCMNQEMSTSSLGDEFGGITTPESAIVDLHQKLQPKRKLEMSIIKPELGPKYETNAEAIDQTPKRRCQGRKNKNIHVDSKKNLKKLKEAISNDQEEAGNGGSNGQSSSSCSSEDDSNASQELIAGGEMSSSKGSATLNSNGKARASRGSATDPQSLYARKRRERINERLRILQNLVPNGTKVDISTMLEEAAQYVKFLQLQIKLLSSDDLWMYAPIAYNGMDIGLDLKISPSQ